MFPRRKIIGQLLAKGFPLPGNGPVNNYQLGALQQYQTSVNQATSSKKFSSTIEVVFSMGNLRRQANVRNIG
jgi:hypothetical protein